MSGWVRHGWREPPPPLNRASRCSPDSLPLSVFCQCSHGAADPGGERSIHRRRLDWSDRSRSEDADEAALRRPDHGRRDRRRDSHLRGLPSLPVHFKVRSNLHAIDATSQPSTPSTRPSRTQVGATGPATTTMVRQDDTSPASRTRRTRSSTSNTTTTARPARRARSFSKRSDRKLQNLTYSDDFSSARASTAATNEGSTSAGALSNSATSSAPVTGVPKNAPRHAAAA